MTMSFLAKAGVKSSHIEALNDQDFIVAQAEVAQEETEIAVLRAEIKGNISNIEKVLSAADLVTGLAANGVENKLNSAVFAEALYSAGVPADVAEETAVGCESVSQDEIGNEALDKAKDIVKSIIEWLVAQWKKLKKLIARVFAKHFGSVKRNLEAWRKLKARAEKYSNEAYTLDDKTKLDVKSGAAWFVIGATNDKTCKTPEAAAGIIANVKDGWIKLAEAISKDIEKDVSSIGGYASLSDLSGTPNKIMGEMAKDSGKITVKAFDRGEKGVDTFGKGLLGRLAYILQSRVSPSTLPSGNIADMDAEGLRATRAYVNGTKMGIVSSHTELNVLDEVSLEIFSLADIQTLADAEIDLCTLVLDIQLSKKVDKLETAFDKAIAAAGKWAKDGDDTAEGKRKSAAAAGVMAALLQFQQDVYLGSVQSLASNTGAMSSAHGAACSKMLSRYKKVA